MTVGGSHRAADRLSEQEGESDRGQEGDRAAEEKGPEWVVPLRLGVCLARRATRKRERNDSRRPPRNALLARIVHEETAPRVTQGAVSSA